MDSTLDRLKVLLSEVYDGAIDTSSITEETRLVEEIGMKSIAMLYMAMAIEGEFGVSLTNDDLPKMRTVGDIVELDPVSRDISVAERFCCRPVKRLDVVEDEVVELT